MTIGTLTLIVLITIIELYWLIAGFYGDTVGIGWGIWIAITIINAFAMIVFIIHYSIILFNQPFWQIII